MGMQNAAWQSLYCLESRDVVFDWHKQIYDRELNARRAKEITSSAKQAREFFRNSAQSNDSVRPLLSFYGVASLSRSLSLLLKKESGEQTLNRGHGLETSGWADVLLSGEISEGIGALGTLRIKTSSGLFADFLRETDNRMCIHINSSTVDWRVSYSLPPSGDEITLENLLSRIPDLQGEYSRSGRVAAYARVKEMFYSPPASFKAKVAAKQFEAFKNSYTDDFTVTSAGDFYEVAREADLTTRCAPQFMHTYVNKMFGAIPTLHIVKPMASGARYSQLAVTYMTSYILGMLARYFRTHWVSLLSGEKGDALWPAINAAQRYIDSAFPEMVVEFIHDTLDQAVRGSQTPADPALRVV